MPSTVIYIHGFNSSPQSIKAQQLQQYFIDACLAEKLGYQLHVPALDYQPETAIKQLTEIVDRCSSEPILLIGSSLGGYYSLWLAAQYPNVCAVLINPAVYPYQLLENLLGENQNLYTGQRYQLTAQHIAQLKNLDVTTLTEPSRVLLLTQTGDETLDYKQAIDKYPLIEQRVTRGGDHSYVGFDKEISAIFDFFSQFLQLKKP